MTKGLARIRGAIGMGLAWAVGWAIAGVLIGAASNVLPGLPWNSFFQVFDAPLPLFALPGFIAGALFSLVLGIAARRQRVDELSLLRVGVWGAISGAVLFLIPCSMVAVGLASREGSAIGIWQTIAVLGVPAVLLSAVSASGSLILARRGKERQPITATDASHHPRARVAP